MLSKLRELPKLKSGDVWDVSGFPSVLPFVAWDIVRLYSGIQIELLRFNKRDGIGRK